MKKSIFILFLGALLMQACNVRVPMGLPDEDEMEDLLYDYHLAQAMAESQNDSIDYNRYSYIHSVFEKHGITEEEFDTAMIWYSKHATRLAAIYKRLDARFLEQTTGIRGTHTRDIYAEMETSGDTANIWNDYDFKVLTTSYGSNRYSFDMQADTSFYRGDEFIWRFDVRYITKNRRGDAYSCFYVRYDNDSSFVVNKRIYGNGKIELRCLSDSTHRLTEIGGFVYFKKHEKEESANMMIMEHIRLARFHHGGPDTLMVSANRTDSIATDSLSVDSIVNLDVHILSENDSTVETSPDTARRMSPTELRDSKPVERTIHVVKEKPYRVIRRKK